MQKDDAVVGMDELPIVHQIEDMFVMIERIVLHVLVELQVIHIIILLII